MSSNNRTYPSSFENYRRYKQFLRRLAHQNRFNSGDSFDAIDNDFGTNFFRPALPGPFTYAPSVYGQHPLRLNPSPLNRPTVFDDLSEPRFTDVLENSFAQAGRNTSEISRNDPELDEVLPFVFLGSLIAPLIEYGVYKAGEKPKESVQQTDVKSTRVAGADPQTINHGNTTTYGNTGTFKPER